MLVVTPNLCFDRTLLVDAFEAGAITRPHTVRVTPGGKGVNVARTLRDLGLAARLLGFVPDRDHEHFTALAAEEGLDLVAVPVPGDLRCATIIIERSARATVLNEPGPATSAEDADRLLAAVDETLGRRGAAWWSAPGACHPACRRTSTDGCATSPAPAARWAWSTRPGRSWPRRSPTARTSSRRTCTRPRGPARPGRRVVPRRRPRRRGPLAGDRAPPPSCVARGARRAVVTAGAHGAAFTDGAQAFWVPAPDVTVRNPIGAGDSLVGGLAAALATAGATGLTGGGWSATAWRSPAPPWRARAPGGSTPDGRASWAPSSRRPRRERPTVYDVAAEAGVSIKTVSRVINGAPNVSPTVRERVQRAAERLHYVPNSLARSLKAGTGDTIGVVIDTIADPFFAALTSAVEERALELGLGTVFGSTGFDPLRERRQVERMAMQRVRALILAPDAGTRTTT